LKKLLGFCVVSAALGGVIGFRVGRTARPSREQVVSYLSELDVADLADLTKGLAAQWGVHAAPVELEPLHR
jgi:cytochrome c553